MSLEASDVLGAVAIGLGATLVMDLWNLFLKRAFSVEPPGAVRRGENAHQGRSAAS